MSDDSVPVESLPNLGPKSGAALRAAGIPTLGALRAAGAVQTYLRLRGTWRQASLNLLWALAGALQGRDWRLLTAVEKRALLDALETLSAADPGSPPAR